MVLALPQGRKGNFAENRKEFENGNFASPCIFLAVTF